MKTITSKIELTYMPEGSRLFDFDVVFSGVPSGYFKGENKMDKLQKIIDQKDMICDKEGHFVWQRADLIEAIEKSIPVITSLKSRNVELAGTIATLKMHIKELEASNGT